MEQKIKKVMTAKLWILLILLAGGSLRARAWELVPEYVFLSEVEQVDLDDPSLTDSEYSSDILAFSRNSLQDYYFFLDPHQVLIGMGSIGSKNFMISDHIKLYQMLTDQLQFRLHYFKEKDFDQEFQAQVVELDYWLDESWALGVYGEGTYRKSEIDFGVTALFRLRESHEVRLWWTAPDMVRNERNKNTDSFSSPPGVQGLKGTWVSPNDKEFLNYSLRVEKPTHWDFPDQGYRYKYKRQSAHLYLRKKWGEDFLTFRWQGDIKWEEKQWIKASSSLLAPVSMKRSRNLGLIEWERPDIFEVLNHSLRLGVFLTHRDYKSNSGEVIQTTVLPHFWYQIPAGNSGGVRDYWTFGGDTSIFREAGDESLIKRSAGERAVTEFRWTTSYDFYFKNQASLRLIFTFDLDEFGSGETWEGGAGIFQTSF